MEMIWAEECLASSRFQADRRGLGCTVEVEGWVVALLLCSMLSPVWPCQDSLTPGPSLDVTIAVLLILCDVLCKLHPPPSPADTHTHLFLFGKEGRMVGMQVTLWEPPGLR